MIFKLVSVLLGLTAAKPTGAPPQKQGELVKPDFRYKSQDYALQEKAGTKIKLPFCQKFLGYQLFDFKFLDTHMRDVNQEKAALVETTPSFGFFEMKLCNKDWALLEDGVGCTTGDATGCKMQKATKIDAKTTKHSTAYFSRGKSAVPSAMRYSFGRPHVKGLHKESKKGEKDEFAGYQLSFNSNEPCTDNKAIQFEYVINVLCDAALYKDYTASFKLDNKKAIETQRKEFTKNGFHAPTDFDDQLGCRNMVVYQGPEGCSRFDISSVIGPVRTWLGAIALVGGLLLAFAGAYSLQASMGFIVFFFATGLLMVIMFMFQFVYDSMLQGEKTTLALVITGCVIGGIVVTFLVLNYVQAYFIPLMGAALGVMGAIVVMTPMAVPEWARIVAYALCAGITFYIFQQYKGFLLYSSTAVAGSFAFFYGLNSIVSSHTKYNLDFEAGFHVKPHYWGYLFGLVFVAVVGWYVQVNYTPKPDMGWSTEEEEEEEEEYSDDEEESQSQSQSRQVSDGFQRQTSL